MLVIPVVPPQFSTPFHLNPDLVPDQTFHRESSHGCCTAAASGCITSSRRHLLRRRTLLRRLSSSSSEGAGAVEVEEDAARSLDSGSTVVRKFYEGINGRDLRSVEDLISDNCVYEDLIFPQPFVGRKAILDFFNKFVDSFSADLQFMVDDITEDDDSAVGVTWHLEWRGKAFPFSRGCSFYRLEVVDGRRQILYGRDSVEPAIKPGESALVIIRGVIWLLQQFPQLAKFL